MATHGIGGTPPARPGRLACCSDQTVFWPPAFGRAVPGPGSAAGSSWPQGFVGEHQPARIKPALIRLPPRPPPSTAPADARLPAGSACSRQTGPPPSGMAGPTQPLQRHVAERSFKQSPAMPCRPPARHRGRTGNQPPRKSRINPAATRSSLARQPTRELPPDRESLVSHSPGRIMVFGRLCDNRI